MNRIYMDNAATTRVTEPVMQAMLPYLTEIYGNPSSVHAFGRDARRALDAARAQVAKALGAKPNEIYFTGCGTESDNWAIRGTAYARKNKGNHIITSAIEHHAILHTCDALKKEGIFFYAAEAGGPSIYRTDLTGNIGIVIGSEGSGVGELIKKKCDGIISLDLYGKVNSLNASVAAGVLMYEVVRRRRIK